MDHCQRELRTFAVSLFSTAITQLILDVEPDAKYAGVLLGNILSGVMKEMTVERSKIKHGGHIPSLAVLLLRDSCNAWLNRQAQKLKQGSGCNAWLSRQALRLLLSALQGKVKSSLLLLPPPPRPRRASLPTKRRRIASRGGYGGHLRLLPRIPLLRLVLARRSSRTIRRRRCTQAIRTIRRPRCIRRRPFRPLLSPRLKPTPARAAGAASRAS